MSGQGWPQRRQELGLEDAPDDEGIGSIRGADTHLRVDRIVAWEAPEPHWRPPPTLLPNCYRFSAISCPPVSSRVHFP